MTTTAIQWDSEAKMLGADPTATLALDRSAWERLGAIFTQVDDGDGETPGLATATVQVANVPVQFGVLYYSGGDTTYLLLPGTDPERRSTIALLETLQAARALRIDTDLLDLANGQPPLTLEDRVAALERRLAETQSELTARARRRTKGSGKWLGRKSPKTSRSSMQGTVK
jgi:hypothetical protein